MMAEGRIMRMPGIRHLTACLLLFTATGVRAEILKCKDAAGNVTYTQGYCPPGTRPAELPEGVAQDIDASSSSSGADRRLSPRAAALRSRFAACIDSPHNGCAEYQRLFLWCTEESNLKTPDCVALRELNFAVAEERGREAEREQSAANIEAQNCSPNMLFEGSNASVRACSKFRSLPSTARWAQVKDYPNRTGPGPKWTGEYVCLRFIALPDASGGTLRARPILTIQRELTTSTAGESYRVENLRNKMTFPTKEAAVEYGCSQVDGK
jgi:hypothetical protein